MRSVELRAASCHTAAAAAAAAAAALSRESSVTLSDKLNITVRFREAPSVPPLKTLRFLQQNATVHRAVRDFITERHRTWL